MYVVLIRTPRLDLPDIGEEIQRVEVATLSAAEEAARSARSEGKDAVILRQPVRFTVGPDGVIREIQWR